MQTVGGKPSPNLCSVSLLIHFSGEGEEGVCFSKSTFSVAFVVASCFRWDCFRRCFEMGVTYIPRWLKSSSSKTCIFEVFSLAVFSSAVLYLSARSELMLCNDAAGGGCDGKGDRDVCHGDGIGALSSEGSDGHSGCEVSDIGHRWW